MTVETTARNARHASAFAARGKKAPPPTPEPCPCGCGVLVDPGPKGRRYVDEDHKRRYEHQARRPRALPGHGRKRAMRAEIGKARLFQLWLIADQLGVQDWREALDRLIGEHLDGEIVRRWP